MAGTATLWEVGTDRVMCITAARRWKFIPSCTSFIFIAWSFQVYVLIVEMTVFVYLFLNYVIANPPTLQYCVILFIFYISIGEITLYCISCFRYCVLFSRKYFYCRCSRDTWKMFINGLPVMCASSSFAKWSSTNNFGFNSHYMMKS